MTKIGQLTRLLLAVLIILSGLCTIFALIVTAAQAWQEHIQAKWPEVTAHVDTCDLNRTGSNGKRKFYIQCRLIYVVGDEQNAANIFSTNVPAPEVWQYPPDQVAPFEEWVDRHPHGTPIIVRYDPVLHTKAVLVATDMPRGGPRTPNNLKLLEVCAGSFVVLLTLLRMIGPVSTDTRG